MRLIVRLILVVVVSYLPPGYGVESEQAWVSRGADGKLLYRKTERGDRIMDFSHAGYMGGGVSLPAVPVKRTINPPASGDATELIQRAINEVENLPLVEGFRGVVLLEPGRYVCSNVIRVAKSGVVLRGKKGTTISLAGRPRTGIVISATEPRDGEKEVAELQTRLADGYVPAGADRLRVVDAKGFLGGDRIVIKRPVTEAWIKFMRMDDLVRDGRAQSWLKPGTVMEIERVITAIHGEVMVLDVPLPEALDTNFSKPPGIMVNRITSSSRLERCGIESLQIEAPPQAISHSEPHFSAIRMHGEDCWVSEVGCLETMNSVAVSGRRITLHKVLVTRKARHQGSSRPAEFAPNGSQVLMDRCEVNADNVWFAATGARVAGPIVLLNCVFRGEGKVESHQRWSTGLLYDHCEAKEGGFEMRNRGSMGSGHGWSMGWGVAWNCVAREFVVQNPPGSLNWMIGCVGERSLKPRPFGTAPLLEEGTVQSHGTHVHPGSLYLAQLEERSGKEALRNIGYEVERGD